MLVLILIFPLILTNYFYLDYENKRLYFAVYFFGKFNVLSGYVNKRDLGGFYVHLKDNYAIIIDKDAFIKFKQGPNFFKYIELNLIYVVLDSGLDNVNFVYCLYSITKIINKIAFIYFNNDNLLKIRFDLNLYNKNDSFMGAKIKNVISFNLICILQAIFANAISKGVDYVKRKKVQFKRLYS